jgi:hypothetical protein
MKFYEKRPNKYDNKIIIRKKNSFLFLQVFDYQSIREENAILKSQMNSRSKHSRMSSFADQFFLSSVFKERHHHDSSSSSPHERTTHSVRKTNH